MKVSTRHSQIISAIRSSVPDRPGVYLFKDPHGRTIYIGKSIHLRRRMLSYFHPDSTRMENRIREMAFNIGGFDYVETATELLALLLEDHLIKRELPWYNIRQKEFSQYKYLGLTRDPYPTCIMMDHEADSGDVTPFGPFRDRYFVDDVLEIIHRHFHLRSCLDTTPHRHSMNYDVGRCKSPCRNKISVADYAEIVTEVTQFLNGAEDIIIPRIKDKLETCLKTLDYEKALVFQSQIGFCRKFCARQRFIRRFRSERIRIVVPGKVEQIYHFSNEYVTLETGEREKRRTCHTLDFRDVANWTSDQRFQLDRANILYNWINKRKGIVIEFSDMESKSAKRQIRNPRDDGERSGETANRRTGESSK